MPYGPKGEWRPADPVACAVHVAKIATGEIEETFAPPAPSKAASAAGRKAAKARSEALKPSRRREIAQGAARARWAREAE